MVKHYSCFDTDFGPHQMPLDHANPYEKHFGVPELRRHEWNPNNP